MMNGHLSDEQLNEYLDGTLPEDQLATVESHLSHCNPCQDQLADLEAVFVSLENLPDVRLDRDLAPQVLEGLRRSTPSWAAGRWVLLLQILLTLLVLVFSGPLVLNRVLENLNTDVEIFSALAAWGTELQAVYAGLSASLDFALQNWTSQLPQLPTLPWSGLTIGLWIAALGLGWLIINGAILRPSSDRNGNEDQDQGQ